MCESWREHAELLCCIGAYMRGLVKPLTECEAQARAVSAGACESVGGHGIAGACHFEVFVGSLGKQRGRTLRAPLVGALRRGGRRRRRARTEHRICNSHDG